MLGLFLPENPIKGFFQKNHKVYLSLYAATASCKNSKRFHPLTFPETCETSIWALLDQKPRNKNPPRVNFS